MTGSHLPFGARTRRRLPDWLLPLLCCCAASFCLLLPFFRLGTASGHDFEFHAPSWLDVAYQWKEGIWYPRWTAWTNHGFGEPRFIFYPPLSWMLGAALTRVLPGPAVPMVYVLLTQTLAGIAAYLLLRRLTARRAAAVLGAVFYSVNPNALLMVYIRSDFAEQLACALFPLLLLAALYVCELLQDTGRLSRNVAAFAVLYAGVWLCNAPAGVIASYALALLIAWSAWTRRSWRLLARGGVALALGLALAAFYIVPAAYEQRWVNIGQALSSGLAPAQNFLFTAIDDVEHTWFNWIASICAVLLMLVLGLAALLSRRLASRKPEEDGRRAAFAGLLLVGAAATALMTRWTLPLWEHLPKLRFVQFPWRWMSVVALIAAVFLAAMAEKRRMWLAIALLLALMVPLGRFLVHNTWWDEDEMPTMQDGIDSGKGFEGTDEYDPLGDDHLDLPVNAPLVKVLAADSGNGEVPKASVQVQKWTTEQKAIQVDTPAAIRLALRVLNYPAWRVEVNGQEVQPGRMDDVNQMVVPVNPGVSQIRVQFITTMDRKLGDGISMATGLALLVLFFGKRQRENA